MEFKCIKGKLTWSGKINIFRENKEFVEFEICSMGKSFHAIIGKNYYGTNYICIPNWNISSELADFTDTFWNTEKLIGQLSELDAITIVKAVFIVAETLEFK